MTGHDRKPKTAPQQKNQSMRKAEKTAQQKDSTEERKTPIPKVVYGFTCTITPQGAEIVEQEETAEQEAKRKKPKMTSEEQTQRYCDRLMEKYDPNHTHKK